MKNVNYYLEEYKKAMSVKTDMELAKLIKVGRSQIYKAKKGNIKSIGRKKYIDIAKKLKVKPIIMIATLEAEKEKDEEIRKIWVDLIKEKSQR